MSGEFLKQLMAVELTLNKSPFQLSIRWTSSAVNHVLAAHLLVVTRTSLLSKILASHPLCLHSRAVIRPPTPATEIKTKMPLGSLRFKTLGFILYYRLRGSHLSLSLRVDEKFGSRKHKSKILESDTWLHEGLQCHGEQALYVCMWVISSRESAYDFALVPVSFEARCVGRRPPFLALERRCCYWTDCNSYKGSYLVKDSVET